MEQQLLAFDDEPPPPLDGKLVEVHGVGGAVEAESGQQLDPNGLRGRAIWDYEASRYKVYTFNGHALDMPPESLREFARPRPEDGGFDYAWPAPGQEEAFSIRIADTIRKKGFCVVQMFEPDEQRSLASSAARDLEEWVLPKPEFEEAYLGRDAASKVFMVRQDTSLDAPLHHYDQMLKMMAAALYPVVTDFLGIRPDNYRSSTMVRLPLLGPAERGALSPGPVSQEEVAAGVVEGHLDFVQRRRLCMMYLVDNRGGQIELLPREDLRQPPVRLPITRDKILVFRHDLMSYSYRPRSTSDLVVQSWLMEEEQRLRVDGIEGDQEAMEQIMGITGMAITNDRKVHIVGANSRMPGGSYQPDRYWSAKTQAVDGFLHIPLNRWDMIPYYNPDSEQFGAQGKSVTRHAGLLGDEELMCFDNKFFGLQDDQAQVMAPSQRILMEISWELLHFVGYEKFSDTRGEQLIVTVAECALDMDIWYGYQWAPNAWLTAQFNYGTSAARLAMTFGLTGPLQQVDTACSSSLVSHNIVHSYLRKNDNKSITKGASLGHQTLNLPWGFLGLSGAGMLGRTGRCLAFDQSANGMARAEGCGGLFLKVGDDVELLRDRMGVYVSSFINQDGRSASLTAPNGPSQQLCMRSSMKDGLLAPADITTNENHGTGTALGDPIETGSVRSIFRGRGDCPIPVTSSKASFGHQESTAGSNGLIRTLLSMVHCAVPTTLHVRQLNQHLDLEGFPGCFPGEMFDCGKQNNIGGLNSFGFGGTNSRAELWAQALTGFRAADSWHYLRKSEVSPLRSEKMRQLDAVAVLCPRCLGPMCWLCGMALPSVPQRGKHRCAAVREELASYEHCSDCYKGAYSCGGGTAALVDRGDRIYVTGTWNRWGYQEMELTGDGIYVAEVPLGDTCQEEFHLVLEKDSQRAIFPAAAKASGRARVLGPQKEESGRNWLLDGRRDGASTGSMYQIRFEWGEVHRKMSWELLDRPLPPDGGAAGLHGYSVVGSFRGFRPEDMQPVEGEPGVWEFSAKVSRQREELFMFQRDRDPKQLIYPLEHRPSRPSVPVVGPDLGPGVGQDMRLWSVRGKEGDVVILRLRVLDGDIEVTAVSEAEGEQVWKSAPRGPRERYFVAGSWSSWVPEEMEPDAVSPDVCRHQFTMHYASSCEFHILANKDPRRILHPANQGAGPGEGLTLGPDAEGADLHWEVNGPPGQVFEITLDLCAEDSCKVVTCRPIRRLRGLQG